MGEKMILAGLCVGGALTLLLKHGQWGWAVVLLLLVACILAGENHRDS